MCAACENGEPGLAHLAAKCTALTSARQEYVRNVSAARRSFLQDKNSGDWAMSVFAVAADQVDLLAAVQFGDAIARSVLEGRASGQ